MNKMVVFFRSVLAESKHISWAGKKAVAGFTVVVLVLVLVVSFFILLVDFLISKGVGVFV
ncbi:MAG: preprotein translocase subunit SecE [bacterium]